MIAAFRKATRLVVMVHASNVSGALQPVDAVVAAAPPRDPDADRRRPDGGVRADRPFLPAGGPAGRLRSQGASRAAGDRVSLRPGGVPIVPLIEGGRGTTPSPTASRNSSRRPRVRDAEQRGGGWARRLPCVDPAKGGRGDPPQGGRPRRPAAPRIVEDPGVTVYGPADPARRGSAVSFRVEGVDPAEVGVRLEKRSGVLVRAGLHCSRTVTAPSEPSPPGPCA